MPLGARRMRAGAFRAACGCAGVNNNPKLLCADMQKKMASNTSSAFCSSLPTSSAAAASVLSMLLLLLPSELIITRRRFGLLSVSTSMALLGVVSAMFGTP